MAKNNRLKMPGPPEEFTPDQALEYMRCMQDPVYFIENYCKITHPTKGMVGFQLYDFQRDLVRSFHENRNTIVCASRQIGKSQTSCGFLLWYACFQKHKEILIVSNKAKNAKDMVKRIIFMYENLPNWIKPAINPNNWNKLEIEFANKNRIVSEATTEQSGRGMSISLLFGDEFAFTSPNISEDFWTSISPTLSTGGKCILASTPNGDDNKFAELWRGANLGNNGFVPFFVQWDTVPGRDEAYKQQEIGKIGIQKWEQEYECLRGNNLVDVLIDNKEKTVTIEKLHHTLALNKHNALHQNTLEYKIQTPNGWESFAGVAVMGTKPLTKLTFDDGMTISGTDNHIFFTPDNTEILLKDTKIGTQLAGQYNTKTIIDISADGHENVYDIIETESHTFYANGVLSHNCKFISSDPLLFSSTYITNYYCDTKATPDARDITWFGALEPGKSYVIAIDPATGTGSDYTVMILYSFPDLVQIAQFRSNTTSTPLVYSTFKHLLRTVQASGAENCYWSFENNGIGEGFISMYESDENQIEFGDLISEPGKRRIGFFTGKNKTNVCLLFKQIFESGKMKINSPVVISEMKNFVRRSGSFAARTGSNDDAISAHLILVRMLQELVQYEERAYDVVFQHKESEDFFSNDDYEDYEPPAPVFGHNGGMDVDFNQFFPDGW